MKRLCLAILPLLAAPAAFAVPVWSTDVAPIIYNRCATCHHDGGIAPFNLMSYSDVIAHASTVKTEVQSGAMPPWPPDPAYGRLAHERVLSSYEKAKILDWLNGGRPQGDMSLAPPTPVFADKGDLPGTPSLVVKIPTYTSAAGMGDIYRCFVLPTGMTADKYITAFEAIPGNRALVHHVLVYADTTGKSTTLDAQDPGPGYTSFGGIGTDNAILLGGWVPGSAPLTFPSGFGCKLPATAKVVVQIHYPAGTAGMKDSTEIHFFFSPTNTMRDVFILPILNYQSNITTPLVIPKNTVQSFVEKQVFPIDATLMGVTPHMHLLGKKIQTFSVSPTGDTQRYINVPDWDFHWQGFYMLKQLRKIPSGSTAYALATYDNTTANPMNPNNPPKDVIAGEATTDEMMLVYYVLAYYQPGDENIVLDNSVPAAVNTVQPYYNGVQLLQSYPVPAGDQLIAKYHLDEAATGSLEIVNMAGQVVLQALALQKLAPGYTAVPVNVSSLATGAYTLRLNAGGQVRTQSISVRH